MSSRWADLSRAAGRRVLATVRMLVLLILFTPHTVLAGVARSSAARPNLLFIVTDDQRWDALGVVQREQGRNARFAWFQTPHLDRIAAEGARFKNAFVVHSLCSPSRAAFISGQYGHRNGIVDNSTHLPASAINQAVLLRDAGYQTAYIGKFHMAFQKERPGFDYVASYTSQGEYFGSTFLVNGQSRKSAGWLDDVATDDAIDYIRSHAVGQPWMMMLGYKSAHTPRIPPERARARFIGEFVKRAANADATPIYGRGQRAFRGEETGKPFETDTDSQGSDEYLLNYFRCLSAVDDNIGRLLAVLDNLHLATNTVVVFASDNGYFLGEHGGLGDKRSAYDESMRIPLLMRYPALIKAGTQIEGMVLNIDLAPTFLELAGITPPREMQGSSWLPLLKRGHANWRRSFMFEYFFEPNLPATPAMLAVRTASAKMIVYPDRPDWIELFDLRADPFETRNLATSSKHAKMLRTMWSELTDQQARFGDPFAKQKSDR
jgi:arylsulfatase A-like enzyme